MITRLLWSAEGVAVLSRVNGVESLCLFSLNRCSSDTVNGLKQYAQDSLKVAFVNLRQGDVITLAVVAKILYILTKIDLDGNLGDFTPASWKRHHFKVCESVDLIRAN